MCHFLTPHSHPPPSHLFSLFENNTLPERYKLSTSASWSAGDAEPKRVSSISWTITVTPLCQCSRQSWLNVLFSLVSLKDNGHNSLRFISRPVDGIWLPPLVLKMRYSSVWGTCSPGVCADIKSFVDNKPLKCSVFISSAAGKISHDDQTVFVCANLRWSALSEINSC